MSVLVQRRVAGGTALVILLYVLHATLTSASAFAASVTPETTPGLVNPKCADVEGAGQTWLELKVDPNANGQYVSADGQLTVTISNTTNDKSFDWSSNIGVDAVIVKGGNAGNHVYRYDPPTESTGDTGLQTPDGNGDGISHISFCYDLGDAEPGSANLIVRKIVEAPVGVDAPDTSFTITIDGETPFPLADGQSSSQYTYEVPAEGSISIDSITEAVPADDNWTGVSVSCTNGESSNTNSITDVTLDDGATVICTFTNVYTPDGVASVTVVKSVPEGSPAANFGFTATDKAPFDLAGGGQTVLVYEIPLESEGEAVTVAENVGALPQGWAFGSVSCTIGEQSVGTVNGASVDLVLDDGDDITCVFSNRWSQTTTPTNPTTTPTNPPPPTATTLVTFDEVPEVLGTTITAAPAEVSADTLPFTGTDAGDFSRLGILALLAGWLMISALRGPKRERPLPSDTGGWSSL